MQKIDKIYLDIDGVIRGVASPREDVMRLLRHCIDNLFESDKAILERYYVLDGFFRMNLRDPEMAKKALEFLKSFKKDS